MHCSSRPPKHANLSKFPLNRLPGKLIIKVSIVLKEQNFEMYEPMFKINHSCSTKSWEKRTSNSVLKPLSSNFFSASFIMFIQIQLSDNFINSCAKTRCNWRGLEIACVLVCLPGAICTHYCMCFYKIHVIAIPRTVQSICQRAHQLKQ